MSELTVTIAELAGGADGRIAKISGEMTIMNACQARDALLDLFATEMQVCIDVKDVTEVDLTGLQLLCAAHRAAIVSGKHLIVDWDGNVAFDATARAAGFPREVGCTDDTRKSCIWGGGD